MSKEAVKLALEALEDANNFIIEVEGEDAYRHAITALEEALAKQEQGEPVAIYQFQNSDGSWIDQAKHSYDYNVKHGHATVRIVYTTPQQHKPLTDGSKTLMFQQTQMPLVDCSFSWYKKGIADAEAAHGIKE